MRRRLFFLLILLFMSQWHFLWAYHGDVHMKIDEYAVKSEVSQLDPVLKGELGFADGIETILAGKDANGNRVKKMIKKWIAYGGEAEDYGWPFNANWLTTRGFNHFHDPLKDWDEAGLDNEMAKLIYHGSYFTYPVSPILWGLKPEEQDFFWNFTGDWSWGKAREYYYHALTTPNDEESNKTFADCFRALGQVMHLLQDVSVPLHTRNDVHVFPLLKIPVLGFYLLGKWNYETYTKEYLKDAGAHKLDFIPDQPDDRPDPILLTDPQPDPTYTNIVPISGLFDRNQYHEGAASPPHDATIGLAEYSNANFLTEDTMWKYQHPRIQDTTYQEIDWLNPEEVVAEDGDTDCRLYIRYQDSIGINIAHLAAVDYWFEDYADHAELEHTFLLDEACWKDYAEKLIPRAVGYSAALLDYFFRGEMGVACLPIFFDNGIYALWVKIMNTTSTQESMSNGTFSLVCRYTPTGGSPDGTDDIFVQCSEVACDTLQHGDEYEALFFLSQSIPIEHYQSVRCMLAFQGSLGNESGAVVGKSFTLGEIKFNEEWDNGLDGNYPWTHTTADDNPPNGSTINTIENGILIKKNIRYEGNRTARYNTSFLYIPGSGVAITPSSYLQFKIDELSINEIPPAPEGYKTHDQELMLYFNDGDLNLQFSVDDQWVNLGWPNVGYYSFTPEAIMIDNIHQLFTNYGIAIPDPLYLNRIGFGQQLWNLDDPSTVEHTQTMRVDFIRVIEEKQEEGQQ